MLKWYGVIAHGNKTEKGMSDMETQDTIKEVEATLRLEGMQLTAEELDILKRYKSGEISGKSLREKFLSEAEHG